MPHSACGGGGTRSQRGSLIRLPSLKPARPRASSASPSAWGSAPGRWSLPEPPGQGGKRGLPDDHNDTVENVVRVPDVAQRATCQQLQQHLQGEHAGEHDVADLQGTGQLIRLWAAEGPSGEESHCPYLWGAGKAASRSQGLRGYSRHCGNLIGCCLEEEARPQGYTLKQDPGPLQPPHHRCP